MLSSTRMHKCLLFSLHSSLEWDNILYSSKVFITHQVFFRYWRDSDILWSNKWMFKEFRVNWARKIITQSEAPQKICQALLWYLIVFNGRGNKIPIYLSRRDVSGCLRTGFCFLSFYGPINHSRSPLFLSHIKRVKTSLCN